MAKPINLRDLTPEERGVLMEAIPYMRKSDKYEHFHENPKFMEIYQKWLVTTDFQYKEDAWEQFKMAVSKTRKNQSLEYKKDNDERWTDANGDLSMRKYVPGDNQNSELRKKLLDMQKSLIGDCWSTK